MIKLKIITVNALQYVYMYVLHVGIRILFDVVKRKVFIYRNTFVYYLCRCNDVILLYIIMCECAYVYGIQLHPPNGPQQNNVYSYNIIFIDVYSQKIMWNVNTEYNIITRWSVLCHVHTYTKKTYIHDIGKRFINDLKNFTCLFNLFVLTSENSFSPWKFVIVRFFL